MGESEVGRKSSRPGLRHQRSSLGSWGSEEGLLAMGRRKLNQGRKLTRLDDMLSSVDVGQVQCHVPLMTQEYIQSTERSEISDNPHDGVILVIEIINYQNLTSTPEGTVAYTQLLETVLQLSQRYKGDVVNDIGKYISLVWLCGGSQKGFQVLSEKVLLCAQQILSSGFGDSVESIPAPRTEEPKIRMGVASGSTVLQVVGSKREWRCCLTGSCFVNARKAISELGGSGLIAMTVGVHEWITQTDKNDSDRKTRTKKLANGFFQLIEIQQHQPDNEIEPEEDEGFALGQRSRLEGYIPDSHASFIAGSSKKTSSEATVVAISFKHCNDSILESIVTSIVRESAYFDGEFHSIIPDSDGVPIFLVVFGISDHKHQRGGIRDEVSRAIQFAKTMCVQMAGLSELYVGLATSAATLLPVSSADKKKKVARMTGILKRNVLFGSCVSKAIKLMTVASSLSPAKSIALSDSSTKALLEDSERVKLEFVECANKGKSGESSFILEFNGGGRDKVKDDGEVISGRSGEILKMMNVLTSIQKGARSDVEEHHRSVLITGDMGIGKTRFLCRIKEIAVSRRVTVLTCNHRDMLYVSGERYSTLCELFCSKKIKYNVGEMSEELSAAISFLINGKQRKMGGDTMQRTDEQRGHCPDIELSGELVLAAAVRVIDAVFVEPVIFLIDDCDIKNDESMAILTQLLRLYSRIGIVVTTIDTKKRNATITEVSGTFSSATSAPNTPSNQNSSPRSGLCSSSGGLQAKRSWCANVFSFTSCAVVHICLNALDSVAMSSLLMSFATNNFGKRLSQNASDLLVSTCNGNPGFGEQLLRYLVESEKVLEIKSDTIGIRKDIIGSSARGTVPSGTIELFEQRFNLVSDSYKKIMKCCALLRPIVTLQDITILAKLADDPDEAVDVCAELVKLKYFKLIDGIGWRFLSEQNRIHLLELMTDEERPDLHLIVASVLIEIRSQGEDVSLSKIMMHYTKGGEVEKCLVFATEAVSAAYLRGKYAEAIGITRQVVVQNIMTNDNDTTLVKWSSIVAAASWELGQLESSVTNSKAVFDHYDIKRCPTSWIDTISVTYLYPWLPPLAVSDDMVVSVLRTIRARCLVEYQREDLVSVLHLSAVARPLIDRLLADPPSTGTGFVDILLFFSCFQNIKPYATIKNVIDLKKKLLETAKCERSPDLESGTVMLFMFAGLTRSLVQFEYPLTSLNALTKLTSLDMICYSILSKQPSVWDRLKRMHGVASAESDLLMVAYAKSLLQYTQLLSGVQDEDEATVGLDELIEDSFADLREAVSPKKLLLWVRAFKLCARKRNGDTDTLDDAIALAEDISIHSIPGMIPLLTLNCLMQVLSGCVDCQFDSLQKYDSPVCRVISALKSLQKSFAYARPVYVLWKSFYLYHFKNKTTMAIADIKISIAESTYFQLPSITLLAEEILVGWTGAAPDRRKTYSAGETSVLLQ